MIFNSSFFMILFLGFVIVYAALQKRLTVRLIFVTAFSYYFYYKSSGLYFILLLVVTISDYFIAHFISKSDSKTNRKLLLATSVTIGLGMLAYFKYANFFGATFAQIINNNFQPSDIFLPVGISFFTFQSLSYTIDVYRKNIKPLNNLLDYAFFVSFFPQLVAGPIVRASDFIPQIRKPLCFIREVIGQGLFLVLCVIFTKGMLLGYL